MMFSSYTMVGTRPQRTYGLYQISGTCARLGVVGSYKVSLYERWTGRKLLDTVSDTAGNYVFQHLADSSYFVVAFDDTGTPVNAAISDYVTPEPMA